MADKETSIRDDLEAAIEADESEQPEIEERDEEGRQAAQEGAQEEVSEEAVREDPNQPEEDRVEDPAGKPAKAAKGPTAPVDWSPTVKDKWKDLPPEVQQAIAKRERDVNVTLEQTTSARRISEHFIKTVEPYRAIMAAEGVQDPMVAINGLMNTAAQLQVGNPQQKAQRIAGLIKHYGIDIELLDSVLAGEQLPQGQQQPASDPRIDQIWQRMQQAEQNQQQQVTYQAHQSIGEFAADPKNEFFEHVRLRMADILDVARVNNEQMSLEDAYSSACYANPEIRGILQKRQMYGGQGMMEQKKAASSSISGRRSSGSDAHKADNMSLRELLESQMGDTGRI